MRRLRFLGRTFAQFERAALGEAIRAACERQQISLSARLYRRALAAALAITAHRFPLERERDAARVKAIARVLEHPKEKNKV